MGIVSKGTWVVVADGEKALIYKNVATAFDPRFRLVTSLTSQHLDQQIASDRPGRRTDGGPGQKSAMEQTDQQRRALTRFAQDLAERLLQQERRGKYPKLVLVAAPQVMGALRRCLHKSVLNKVVAQIDKTLTNHKREGLERVLKSELVAV
ncbi:host attachment family protein [Shimia sp. MMG029]|uniref:host attachment family protein n=1 Tax=Shimia sp. MMG029 TaxID=3021978 RepID=UPI0022FEACD0|nr:host attachment family protein [Shimia sp. MMG029]MDA5555537.1 host attachment family protein [Shimia sp. MMG029]